MISYALSVCAFGTDFTPETAAALRQSKFRNLELSLLSYFADDEKSRAAAALTRELLAENTIRAASVHLPFCGANLNWDPSSLDEAERREVVERQIRLIRKCSDLMGPMVTLHASTEPPLEEHPQRIGQVCKSIEELLPTARELGFIINVEFLPRTCVGNCAEELLQIVSHFDPSEVGICLDVNHIMARWRELPQLIDTLAPRVRSFHLSDYDGIDETHWLPGQGIIGWREVMKHIRAIDHDLLLILETTRQLKRDSRPIDPLFSIRQNERSVWFLENCDRLVPEIESFRIPGGR